MQRDLYRDVSVCERERSFLQTCEMRAREDREDRER